MLTTLIIISAALAIFCLLILHFTSPEFKPSWRMISEYALGKHKWLITAFFLLWGLSSFLLSVKLWDNVSGFWATLGVVLLFISGIGEIMGGLFDVKHKLHGLSFGLGVPTLPAASLIISYHMCGAKENCGMLLLSAHSTWLSLILMAFSMIVMMSGFKKAGMPMGPDSEPPTHVPNGVIALAGYANRFLVVCYVGWLMIVAYYLST